MSNESYDESVLNAFNYARVSLKIYLCRPDNFTTAPRSFVWLLARRNEIQCRLHNLSMTTYYYSCYVFALVISALLLIDLCPKRRGLHIDIVSVSFLACNDRFMCSINDKNQSGNNLCNFRCHFDGGMGTWTWTCLSTICLATLYTMIEVKIDKRFAQL